MLLYIKWGFRMPKIRSIKNLSNATKKRNDVTGWKSQYLLQRTVIVIWF